MASAARLRFRGLYEWHQGQDDPNTVQRLQQVTVQEETLSFEIRLGREYQKLGCPVTRADFGDSYEAVMEMLFAGGSGGEDG